MASLGTLVVNLGANTAPLVGGLARAERAVGGFATRTAAMVGKAGVAAAAVGGATIVAGIGIAVKLAAEAEATTVQFKVLTGSMETAKALMADINKFAASTPLQTDEIASAAKSLLAFGSSTDKVISELRMLGDISTGIGAPLGDLAEIYGKARVQGRLFAEDINQLTGRGIPIISELAKQFGVAESEVRGLVEKGQVGFPHLEKALQAMTSQGGKFFGMMEEMSQTTSGKFSTLIDNFKMLGVSLGQLVLPAANAVLDWAIKFATKINEIANAGEGFLGAYLNTLRSGNLEKAFELVTLGISLQWHKMVDSFELRWLTLLAKIQQWSGGQIMFKGLVDQIRAVGTETEKLEARMQQLQKDINAPFVAKPIAAGPAAAVVADAIVGKPIDKRLDPNELDISGLDNPLTRGGTEHGFKGAGAALRGSQEAFSTIMANVNGADGTVGAITNQTKVLGQKLDKLGKKEPPLIPVVMTEF